MPSESEYEPGSDGDSDEHTDDYDDEEVEGDRAESPKDEYIEIAENDCAAVGDATGGTGCVYAEKKSGEEAVDAKKNPGEDDAVVENDAEAEKAPKTSGGEDAEDAEAETENATQVPEDVGTENTTRVPGDETSGVERATAAGSGHKESGSELSAVPPPEKRYRPSKWSKEREIMAASHKNISVTTEAIVAKREWSDWSSFEQDFDKYLESNFLVYRKRNNVPSLRNNREYASTTTTSVKTFTVPCVAVKLWMHNNLELLDILRSADVPMRNLAEFLCAETDCDLSNQDVRNYCKARYGGPDTERKLLRFMDEFVAIPGNYAFILREYDDVVSGLMLVNEAQRDAYRRWGDALLLDWTYNVNNLGFLLGEFMVTAPNGKDFSVCEMLVSNQQKNTIQECISFFLRVVGECITESITIDKDFNEWRILEAQFPRAKVVLCQFHAITAVKKKMTEPKYEISSPDRDLVELA
ncbi:hypothetical protein PRIC2_004271 [Phytophthora ramorum]|uniref:uncharacterized protein n=1 Tax=Phytophthora ramorum TaxID=164328 RepID=UPI0030A67A64|nr:hypothetical protein KRP23_4161 [Phytophthora ramorum]